MKFSKRVNYCLFIFLILLCIIYRLPLWVPHERGIDGLFIHSLSISISNKGYAAWTLHPLSYVGLFAMSYPSATPFIISSLSQCLGITVEYTILLFSILCGLIGASGMYLAAREIKNDDLFVFIAALSMGLAPYFLDGTTWIAGTRSHSIAFVPLLLFFLLKHMKSKENRYYNNYLFLSFLLVVFMIAFHRIGIFALYIILGFFMTTILYKISKRVRYLPKQYDKHLTLSFFLILSMSVLIAFYLPVLNPNIYGTGSILEAYEKGWFFQSESPHIILLNIGISLGGKVGLLLPLGLIAILAYPRYHPKDIKVMFVLVSTILIIPVLPARAYAASFMIPLFAPFIAIGVVNLLGFIKGSRVKFISVFLILLISLSYAWVVKDHWRVNYGSMVDNLRIPENIYSTGMYIRYHTDGTVISNNAGTCNVLTASSEKAILPLGGASMHSQTPEQLTQGFVNPPIAVKSIGLDALTVKTDWLYVPVGVPDAGKDWGGIVSMNVDDARNIYAMNSYNVTYAVIDAHIDSYYYSWGSRQYSRFAVSLPEARYKVFDSGWHVLYFVQI